MYGNRVRDQAFGPPIPRESAENLGPAARLRSVGTMRHRATRFKTPVLATMMFALAASGCAASGGSRSRALSAPTPYAKAFSSDELERIQAARPHVDRAAQEYDVDPALILAVIWVESRFVEKAKSPAGARGLMQLMPATASGLAKQLGESRARSFDPAFNVRAGTYYLARLRERFDGDVRLALAAYNAGPGNVRKWTDGGGDLPQVSQSYLAKIDDAYARFQGTPTESAPVEPASSVTAPPTEPRRTPSRTGGSAPLEHGNVVPEPPAQPGPETFAAPVFEPVPAPEPVAQARPQPQPQPVATPEPAEPSLPGRTPLPGIAD